jgi:hypothetical protein
MDLQAVGQVGLRGMKGKAGRGVAHAVASRTNADEELLAAIIGGAFLALWALTAMKTIRALAGAIRSDDQPDLEADQPALEAD